MATTRCTEWRSCRRARTISSKSSKRRTRTSRRTSSTSGSCGSRLRRRMRRCSKRTCTSSKSTKRRRAKFTRCRRPSSRSSESEATLETSRRWAARCAVARRTDQVMRPRHTLLLLTHRLRPREAGRHTPGDTRLARHRRCRVAVSRRRGRANGVAAPQQLRPRPACDLVLQPAPLSDTRRRRPGQWTRRWGTVPITHGHARPAEPCVDSSLLEWRARIAVRRGPRPQWHEYTNGPVSARL